MAIRRRRSGIASCSNCRSSTRQRPCGNHHIDDSGRSCADRGAAKSIYSGSYSPHSRTETSSIICLVSPRTTITVDRPCAQNHTGENHGSGPEDVPAKVQHEERRWKYMGHHTRRCQPHRRAVLFDRRPESGSLTVPWWNVCFCGRAVHLCRCIET